MPACQQLCKSLQEILHPLLSGCFYLFPGEHKANGAPAAVQAKAQILFDSRSAINSTEIEQAWEREPNERGVDILNVCLYLICFHLKTNSK